MHNAAWQWLCYVHIKHILAFTFLWEINFKKIIVILRSNISFNYTTVKWVLDNPFWFLWIVPFFIFPLVFSSGLFFVSIVDKYVLLNDDLKASKQFEWWTIFTVPCPMNRHVNSCLHSWLLCVHRILHYTNAT